MQDYNFVSCAAFDAPASVECAEGRFGSRNAIRAAMMQATTIQNKAAPYQRPRRSFVESIVIFSAHAARSGSISR